MASHTRSCLPPHMVEFDLGNWTLAHLQHCSCKDKSTYSYADVAVAAEDIRGTCYVLSS